MASIYANGSKGHHKFTLTVTETSTSTANNTSTVSFSFVLSAVQSSWDWYSWGDSISYTVTINGTKYTGTIPNYDGVSSVTLKSGTQTVAHNADGTKSMAYSFSVTDGAGKSYTCGNASKSGTLTLTNIPRKATLLTAPNFSHEDNPTITYSNPAGTAVTSLQACIADTTGRVIYVPYRDISKTGTSYTFELTDSERTALLNAAGDSNSVAIKFYIATTLSGKEYSTLERTFSIVNANPIVTGSVYDSNDVTYNLTGDRNKLVKYYSNATATMSAEAQLGAAINESLYIIRNGSRSGYGTEHTFENVESNVFTFSAEDSRGNIGTDSVTLPMVDYVKPTCNLGNERPDASGNMTVTCFGNYFNGSFGAVSNTLTVEYRYKVLGGSYGNWTSMTYTTSGDTYTATAEVSDLNYLLSYTFETRATDRLDTAYSTESSVRSMPVFHWGENDVVFEVPVTFRAGVSGAEAMASDEGDQLITGDLRLKGSGNYGNTLYFGDASYCYITEATDDVMTIKATRINLEANGVYAYGEPIKVCKDGRWSPTLNHSTAVSSYSVQEGWYQKVGQCVTIGFQVKATIKSGYDSIALAITGVPFTPIYAAFGGGVAHNIKIVANHNFEGWGLSTDGEITARTQPCNNTTAGNLNIGSSSCYPSSGGSVTLAGTICFWANS